jgi:hypothetical protein
MRSEDGERRGGVSRRTLLKAGWSVPVIMTVAPAVAFAASGNPPPTKTTVQPPTTTTTTPTTPQPPGGHHPHSKPPGSPPTPSPPTSVPEQPSRGPQPARINRGFTG